MKNEKMIKIKSENVPWIELKEVVLVYYNSVDNEYQRNSKVLCTFLSDSFWEINYRLTLRKV